MPSFANKVPCVKCGTMILAVTAKYTGGFCRPCSPSGPPLPEKPRKEPYFDAALKAAQHKHKNKIKALLEVYVQPINTIRNCRTPYDRVNEAGDWCPEVWDDLEVTGEAKVRLCKACGRKVFLCIDINEARTHAGQGNYVAMRGPNRHQDIIFEIVKDPRTLQENAIFDANRLDVKRSKELRWLTWNLPKSQDSKNSGDATI